MNSESDFDNLDSQTPHHEKSDDVPDDEIQFVGEVQENEPFIAEIVASESSNRSDSQSSNQPETVSAEVHKPSEIPGNSQIEIASVSGTVIEPSSFYAPAPDEATPIANELSHIAANGGAVGAMVLGIWSILCSLITPFSAINAALAILLGGYGLTSKRQRLAVAGMLLGVVGLVMSLIETNEILTNYFAEEATTG